jgi:hypothetical protein
MKMDDRRRGRRALMVGLIAILLVGASALAYLHPSGLHFPAAIHVDPSTGPADSPLHLWITGLQPNQTVTVVASTADRDGRAWGSYAVLDADPQGTVDPSKAEPLEGSYRRPDPMGLVWSMVPLQSGDHPYLPPGQYRIALAVQAGGRVLTRSSVTRVVAGPGVSVHDEQAGRAGFSGTFFAPRQAGARRPGVLILGESDGSLSPDAVLAAALLASHGYPSLALASAAAPGPPVEYVARALVWLRRQPGVDPRHVLAYGISSAGETALLLAVRRPDLVQAAIALAPGDVAEVVPVEQIAGPILLVCGGADRTWASCPHGQAIVARRQTGKHRYDDVLLRFPDAGHGIGNLVPYQPGTTLQVPTAEGAANAVAAAQAWPRLLAFLARQRQAP